MGRNVVNVIEVVVFSDLLLAIAKFVYFYTLKLEILRRRQIFIPSLIALPPHELIWYCAIYAVSSLHELNSYDVLDDSFVKSRGHKWNIYGVSFPHGQIRCEFSSYFSLKS